MNIDRRSRWVRQVIGGYLVGALEPLLFCLAFLWRRVLLNTRFVLVTGSLGKTTTKELLGQILAQHHSTFRSVRTQNAQRLLLLNVLRVRPWHRFAIIEAGTARPGMLIRASRLLRPDAVVILMVAGTHRRGFSSLEVTAKEKLSALKGLKRGGTAILNGDDPRLNSVESNENFQVLRFGTSLTCDLRADRIEGQWPARLAFEARSSTETANVRTRLVGTHWVPALLASLLTAKHFGLQLGKAAEITARIRPFSARMQPVQLPSGAIIIRDEYNGSPPSYEMALQAFKSAEAERKILIVGDYSDSTIKRRRRLKRLGRTAASLCDLAIFIGEYSHYSREAAIQSGLDPASALIFSYPQDAVSRVKKELRKGDLVLLKSRSNDHLSRLLFAQVGDVLCWRPTCQERFLCDICWRLGCNGSDMAKIKPV